MSIPNVTLNRTSRRRGLASDFESRSVDVNKLENVSAAIGRCPGNSRVRNVHTHTYSCIYF